MGRFKRALGILAVAIALVAAFPVAASASEWQWTSCQDGGALVEVCAYEDTNGGGDNVYMLDGTAEYNLANIRVTTGDGACNYSIFSSLNWNDCISSVRVKLPSGWKLCLYSDASYSGTKWQISGPSSLTGSPWNASTFFGNDAVSSLYFKSTSVAC